MNTIINNYTSYFHIYSPHEIEKTFETLYLQKHYHDKKSFSLINFIVDLSLIPNWNTCINYNSFLKDILSQHEIFHLVFDSRKKKFNFVRNIDLPIAIGNNESTVNQVCLNNYIHSTDNILLYFIYLNTETQKISFWISHYIFDLSCVEIFKNFFYKYDNQKAFDYPKYTEFISYIINNSNNFKLPSSFLEQLATEKILPNYANEPSINYLKIKHTNTHTILSITQRIGYLVSQLILEESNMSNLSGSYIINERNFTNYDISLLLGCVHSVIPFFAKKRESYEEYLENNNYFVNMCKEGIFFKQLAFNRYPHHKDSVEYKLFEELPSLSINFLGYVPSLQLAIKDVKKFRESTRPNATRIYTSIFYYQNDLYIFFVNYIFKNISTINGIQIYKT